MVSMGSIKREASRESLFPLHNALLPLVSTKGYAPFGCFSYYFRKDMLFFDKKQGLF